MSLPPSTSLDQSDAQTLKFVLDTLFEPCDTLKGYLIPLLFPKSYSSYSQLIETARTLLLDLFDKYSKDPALKPTIDKIVSAHPRLGPPKNPNTKLSAHSSKEQAQLNADPVLAQKLVELNDLYEQTFPGLRFVVFVNGRSRDQIMENMNSRIKRNNINLEIQEAFNAMCDIALDRANKLQHKL
ncbi:hypothetical protein OGAPHI_000094 [Ogataea philodendri]|uniref:Oxo-4-hydroxy-4-carboxy-5-ureidoimidazoline decarboxylase domain-containing protein n=1 Tax=Ogataea philodendri TaxID=1378263 RepID=A0A9P8PGL3_9ASCO|nr:uncharacterized protein OGAPHI_000094 [Ogataea philodendri]KAH3671908.1 hypothetical protein OGAPHI_000094 [Ogataea philodendri]